MFVLLTNDDGIEAPGLLALASEFRSRHEVAIVAPDRERSASAHAITVDRPLRAKKIEHAQAPSWAVSGTPGDCVKLAITTLLPRQPDMVISGINRGPNLGTDVFYSGTVAAALEGVLFGLPAIAVSLASYAANANYGFAARVARAVAERLIGKPVLSQALLNINVPNLPDKEIRGISITRLGTRRYRNVFEARKDPRGQIYYWLAGELVNEERSDRDTDIAAVAEGKVSITPLHIDLTDYGRLPQLERWLDEPFDI
ncbi:MAG: 5/3-nucleotidase [Bacillota bacterium]|jgi:5'-nucleotidase|nr:5/3-nucleotidase [Bacillota bacterium]